MVTKSQRPPRQRGPRGTAEISIEHDTNVIVYDSTDIEVVAGAACKHSTFFSNVKWAAGPRGITYSGQMFVEKFEPLEAVNGRNLVLIHGDFHTGTTWLTKPDGMPGWAAAFLKMGYTVYIVDLPGSGRSAFLHRDDYNTLNLAEQSNTLLAPFVEQELTAPEKQPLYDGEPAWESALLHSQWPGTGQRGDPIFDQYMASTITMTLRKLEREALAQIALKDLLRTIGPSVLIGHGAGSTAAWLAADAVPRLVLGVVALEPAGPPCGTSYISTPWGRKYTSLTSLNKNVRKYGLSDIPLTYSPAAKVPTAENPEALDVASRQILHNTGSFMAQTLIPGLKIRNPKPEQESVRQLVQLKQMPHLIVTGEASPHSSFDWATVRFMRQAGADVDYYYLPGMGIYGNGSLMHLERNSDEIAALVNSWMGMATIKSKLLSPELWPDVPVGTRPNAPEGTSNQPNADGQSANSTTRSPENSNYNLMQNDQAVVLAQQTSMPDVFQAGTAVTDAGSQVQNHMGFNGMTFANNNGVNMVGQEQQGPPNQPNVGWQSTNSTTGSLQNFHYKPIQNDQAVVFAQQTSMPGVFQAGTVVADARNQVQTQMSFNEMSFANNNEVNMVGQEQQDASFPFAPSPAHIEAHMPAAEANIPAIETNMPATEAIMPATEEGLDGIDTLSYQSPEHLPSFCIEDSFFQSAFFDRSPPFMDHHTLEHELSFDMEN